MKLLLIFNPNARHGRAHKLLSAIRQEFTARGVATEVLLTRHRGDATEQLAQRPLGPYDGVVAAGGDGTVFEVLNGLYRQPREARKPLGVLPVGTGNAFARDLGLLPGDWRKAIDIIAAGRQRAVDVARVSSGQQVFYFVNIMGMGFAVDAGLTASKLKRLGNVAYTLGTLWQTLRLRSYPLRMEIDGQLLQQDNLLVEIANTRYTGTSFLIAPAAVMDDGYLDVILLRKLPRLRLLRLFPTIYTGRHVAYQEISVRRARSIRLLAPAGLLLGPDGEFYGTTPADVTCLHQDLAIFCP
jgi:diacylglycerol kinase (ATP)